MTKKIDVLLGMMRSGRWEAAIKYAARFPRLGEHRDAILTASSALLSPGMYRDMGRDTEAIAAAGRTALMARYPRWMEVIDA